MTPTEKAGAPRSYHLSLDRKGAKSDSGERKWEEQEYYTIEGEYCWPVGVKTFSAVFIFIAQLKCCNLVHITGLPALVIQEHWAFFLFREGVTDFICSSVERSGSRFQYHPKDRDHKAKDGSRNSEPKDNAAVPFGFTLDTLLDAFPSLTEASFAVLSFYFGPHDVGSTWACVFLFVLLRTFLIWLFLWTLFLFLHCSFRRQDYQLRLLWYSHLGKGGCRCLCCLFAIGSLCFLDDLSLTVDGGVLSRRLFLYLNIIFMILRRVISLAFHFTLTLLAGGRFLCVTYLNDFCLHFQQLTYIYK